MNEITANPSITVAIPTYSGSNENEVSECIESILNQTYDNYDIIIVSETENISKLIESKYANNNSIRKIEIDNPDGGLSRARNVVIEESNSDIICYIDDDATAKPDWLEEIANSYVNRNVPAVGGKAVPVWLSDRPNYVPDEFLWLFGITHRNHPEHGSTVRNTFGCNISYKKSILEKLGGFNEDLGKNEGFNLQGEEPEIGLRMQKMFGTGMYYNENAIVEHKVHSYQCNKKWLANRAFLQGISKAIIKEEVDAKMSAEMSFLKSTISSIGRYFKLGLKQNPKKNFSQMFGIIYFTFLVGMGYIFYKSPLKKLYKYLRK